MRASFIQTISYTLLLILLAWPQREGLRQWWQSCGAWQRYRFVMCTDALVCFVVADYSLEKTGIFFAVSIWLGLVAFLVWLFYESRYV